MGKAEKAGRGWERKLIQARTPRRKKLVTKEQSEKKNRVRETEMERGTTNGHSKIFYRV